MIIKKVNMILYNILFHYTIKNLFKIIRLLFLFNNYNNIFLIILKIEIIKIKKLLKKSKYLKIFVLILNLKVKGKVFTIKIVKINILEKEN
jgi:hypothetical protein